MTRDGYSAWPGDWTDAVKELGEDLKEKAMAVEAVVAVLEGFEREIEARAGDLKKAPGGQRVPFHGDFAGAPPSVISKLRWWAKEFREALTARSAPVDIKTAWADATESLVIKQRDLLAQCREALEAAEPWFINGLTMVLESGGVAKRNEVLRQVRAALLAIKGEG